MQGQIVTEQLSKTYHTRKRQGLFKVERHAVEALSDVSLDIQPGEIFGLLGPNGAGKTTLIKCLTTLLIPSEGRAWLNGYALTQQDNQIRASIGCMLMGERGLYWKLTGRENLVFFGALYHLNPTDRQHRAAEIIDYLDLDDFADRTVETYSSGQRMKLAFAKALINDAPILILDEPTNTLDLPSAHQLRAIVRKLNQAGKTVVYTTHIMAEAETLCDRVAIIDQGQVLALDTVAALKASLGREAVVHVEGVISAQADQMVQQIPGVIRTARTAIDGRTRLTVVGQTQQTLLPPLIEALNAQNALIQKITPEEVTLEDVFVARTGRTLADDTRVR